MGWAWRSPARPSPTHGPKFFQTKTMGGLGRSNFFMGTHWLRASAHGFMDFRGPNSDLYENKNYKKHWELYP